MPISAHECLYSETAGRARIARFVRADLRYALDDGGANDCTLYREIEAAVLTGLGSKDIVVLNFGLVDWFPTAFYPVLLAVREAVNRAGARLIVCNCHRYVLEETKLFQADRIFEIVETEEQALSRSRR
jgi:anti-anti-sigma regulatory factor